jgi:hypothetical protein
LVVLKTTGKYYADQVKLLDSLYTATVMCSESSNIGLVVLDFLLQANAKKTTKPILLDSLYIAAAMCSESSNIGLVG